MNRVLHIVLATVLCFLVYNMNVSITEASDSNSKEHVITFDPDNGKDPREVKVKDGEKLREEQIPFGKIEKGEKDHLGWFYGEQNKYEVLFPFKPTQNMTIVAKWGKHIPPNSIEKPGYRLIFYDEFSNNNGSLNSDLWVDKYLSSWTRTPERSNSTYNLKDGVMSLQINEDTTPWAPEYDGATVVSGFTTGNRNALHDWNRINQVRNPIETELTHINQYGYYEMRAKTQAGSSRHSAWWLLGFEDREQHSAEIDIFEVLGNDPHGVPRALHAWNDDKAFAENDSGATYKDVDSNFHDEWHVYGMDWQEGSGSGKYPDRLVFYVDGKEVGSKNVNITYPMIQLFSLYEKREGGWTGPWEWMPYPNSFDIDYVRVYKKLPSDQKKVPNNQLKITKVEDSNLMVQEGEASLETYTSMVEGHEGEKFVEPNLPGTKSYVNVTWNDGIVTQEFVKWNSISDKDLERLNNGEDIKKKGVLPYLENRQGVYRPTLNIEAISQPHTVLSVSDLRGMVKYHDELNSFANEDVVHSLEVHLIALEHYEQKKKSQKVVKHLNGFKDILNYQENQISQEAHEALLIGVDTLLDEWN